MKKILAGLVLVGTLAIPSSLTEPKTLNSGAPILAGSGNCTYANGLVMTCPPSLIYNKEVNNPQPLQTISTPQPVVASPTVQPPASISGQEPVTAPPPAPSADNQPTPSPITISPDGKTITATTQHL